MKLKLTDLPVVYINLDEQVDRKEKLEENLNELGFKNIIRISGFKDPDPNRGCAYSHALGLEEVDPPFILLEDCLLYTSPSPRDRLLSRMPSSA